MLIMRSFLCLWFLLSASLAMATEVRLTTDVSSGWDNNVARSNNNRKGEYTVRLRPELSLLHDTSRVAYKASYRPNYEIFTERSGYNDMGHNFRASMGGMFGRRTQLNFTENFTLSQSIDRRDDGASVADGEITRGDVYSNQASLTAQYPFTSRTNGIFSFSHGYRNSDRKDTATSSSLTGSGRALYAVSKKHRLGGGVSTTWQRFWGTSNQQRTDTYFYRLFVDWTYQITEHTTFSFNVGPVRVNTRKKKVTRFVNQVPQMMVLADGTLEEAYNALVSSGQIGSSQLPAGSVWVDGVEDAGAKSSINVLQGDVLIMYPNVSESSGGNTPNCRSGSGCVFNGVMTSANSSAAITDASNAGIVDFFNIDASDWRWTVAGSASLSHRWNDRHNSSVSFTRSDAGATTLGQSSESNKVSLQHRWRASERLNLSLTAGWTQRRSDKGTNDYLKPKEVSLDPGGTDRLALANLPNSDPRREVDTTYWRASFQGNYKLTRRSTLTLNSSYAKQKSDDVRSTAGNANFGNVKVMLGYRYSFDPLRF